MEIKDSTSRLRELTEAERSDVTMHYSERLRRLEEASGRVGVEIELAVARGELERSVDHAPLIAATRMLRFIKEAGAELKGLPGYVTAITPEWLLHSVDAGFTVGSALHATTAARMRQVDGDNVVWTQEYWYYQAWMLDSGLPIFTYDNFSGPLCRWDHEGGEVVEANEFGEGATPPDIRELLAEVVTAGEERRLF